jgi:hypothetical protein
MSGRKGSQPSHGTEIMKTAASDPYMIARGSVSLASMSSRRIRCSCVGHSQVPRSLILRCIDPRATVLREVSIGSDAR